MTEINQKEYLKRYLNIGNEDGKKKKRKKKPKNVLGTGLKIVDDDLDTEISTAKTVEEAVSLLETNEDAPQIVGVVDERPFEARIKDYQNTNLWKAFGSQEEAGVSKDSSPPRRQNASKFAGSDSDNSPPRKNKSPDVRRTRRGYDSSPPRRSKSDGKRKQYDSDTSPLRRTSPDIKTKKHIDSSPVRSRKSRQSDSDNSPPRSRHLNKEKSPKAKIRKHSFDSDNSPLRSRNANRVKSPELQRKRNRSPDSDNSPPRNRNRNKSPDIRRSPPSQRRRNSSPDNSPPRNIKREKSPEMRNKRKSRWGSPDASPPRRNNSDSDNSPPRNRKRRDSDSSPPRKRSNKSPESRRTRPEPDRNFNSKDKNTKMSKTLDGKKAGLQNAKDLERENALFRKREDEHFRSMPAEVSGINAAPIMRDKKTGKIRDLKKEEEERLEKEKREALHKEKYSRWGKGVKQMEDKEQKMAQEAYEMTKPLARYADDQDLEKYLREQEREGDPMLAYIRSKRKKQNPETGTAKTSKPQYDGDFMPNRYGIPPGHRWDGVDRSNGYEKRWFEQQNSKKAQEEEIYKWSTEDM